MEQPSFLVHIPSCEYAARRWCWSLPGSGHLLLLPLHLVLLLAFGWMVSGGLQLMVWPRRQHRRGQSGASKSVSQRTGGVFMTTAVVDLCLVVSRGRADGQQQMLSGACPNPCCCCLMGPPSAACWPCYTTLLSRHIFNAPSQLLSLLSLLPALHWIVHPFVSPTVLNGHHTPNHHTPQPPHTSLRPQYGCPP